MNEEAIAAYLAEKARPQVAPEVAPIVEEVVKDANTPVEGPNTLGGLKLMEFFNVPQELRTDQSLLERLNYLHQWAATDIKSEDSIDIMTRLRSLEGQLGLAFRENKLEAMYRWVKLDQERRRVEKEMALL